MKKIITKKQFLMEKAVQYDPEHRERMHPDVERKLSDRSHYLGAHPAFPPSTGEQNFEEKIASKRFADVVSKVKRYGNTNEINQRFLMDVLSKKLPLIFQIESAHKEELENLAVKLVKLEFGLKDEIDLIPQITNDFDYSNMKKDIDEPEEEGGQENEEGEEGSERPFEEPESDYDAENIEDLENAEEEVKKRKFVNALISGAAKKGHYMFHLVEDDLNRIDPRLINLYGLLMSVGDFMYWMVGDSEIKQAIEQTKSGKVTTGSTGDKNDPRGDEEIEEPNEPTETSQPKKHYVLGQGIMFPVVVHELIKGVMEIMSLPSLPQDKKVRDYVLSKADFVQAENWALRLGPGIWEKFLDAVDEDAWEVKNYLYQHIIKMPPQEFNSFMKELLAGTAKGKRELAQLAGEIKQAILDHKNEMEEYERKKSKYDEYQQKKEKTAKQTEDDFMKQIEKLLNPKRPGENNR